jgi:hypothetical protein
MPLQAASDGCQVKIGGVYLESVTKTSFEGIVGIVGLGAGFSCTIVQIGAGQVTLSASGVTMNSYQGYTKIAGQHAGASLFSYSANVFNLNGSLA